MLSTISARWLLKHSGHTAYFTSISQEDKSLFAMFPGDIALVEYRKLYLKIDLSTFTANTVATYFNNLSEQRTKYLY